MNGRLCAELAAGGSRQWDHNWAKVLRIQHCAYYCAHSRGRRGSFDQYSLTCSRLCNKLVPLTGQFSHYSDTGIYCRTPGHPFLHRMKDIDWQTHTTTLQVYALAALVMDEVMKEVTKAKL